MFHEVKRRRPRKLIGGAMRRPGRAVGGLPEQGLPPRRDSAPERSARLQQRLQVAEDPAPATAGALGFPLAGRQRGHLRGALEFVHQGELAHAAAALLDLVREAGESLRLGFPVHEHPPGLDEPPGRSSYSTRPPNPYRSVHSGFVMASQMAWGVALMYTR